MRKLATFALVLTLVSTSACEGEGKKSVPTESHKKACTRLEDTFHQHGQFGGKYYTYTYWCTDKNGSITELWFQLK